MLHDIVFTGISKVANPEAAMIFLSNDNLKREIRKIVDVSFWGSAKMALLMHFNMYVYTHNVGGWSWLWYQNQHYATCKREVYIAECKKKKWTEITFLIVHRIINLKIIQFSKFLSISWQISQMYEAYSQQYNKLRHFTGVCCNQLTTLCFKSCFYLGKTDLIYAFYLFSFFMKKLLLAFMYVVTCSNFMLMGDRNKKGS